jgi:uncharacterized protein
MKTVVAILFIFSSLLGLAQSGSVQPFVLGQVRELSSTVLGEKRTLNIYLPEGYNPKDTIHYPVIYLLDGAANEDFIHIVGLVQFNSFDWVNVVPKSIVVGIATVDRRRDFTYPTTIESDRKKYPTTGHSDKFIAFLSKELQPYIEKTFKTTSSRTLIGQSLGGLVATEILFEAPSMFTQYIIVSPSLWWDNESLLKIPTKLSSTNPSRPTDVFIAVGKEGLTPNDMARVMEVDANVLAEKVKALKNPSVRVMFDYLPAENHATILHQAVMNAFRQLHENKPTINLP